MSLFYLNCKDHKRRLLAKRFELRRKLLKFCFVNSVSGLMAGQTFSNKLQSLPRNASFVRIKNRCVITGRSKSCYRFFKLSRIQLKAHVSKGLLYGVRKSSW
jgi:ribosomal protein S14